MEYKCPECELIFESRRGLGLHRNKKHGYKAPKYQSRAERASTQASVWRDVADRLEVLTEEVSPTLEAAQAILEELDKSELECLLEEITTWRDNMEEKLSNTPKYEEVSSACDELESIDLSECESLSELDDLERVIEELRAAADTLEGVIFPGMF